MLFSRLAFNIIVIEKGSSCDSYRSGCQKACDGKGWANPSHPIIFLVAVIPATLKARLIDLIEQGQLFELILILLNFLSLLLLLCHNFIGRWSDFDLIDALQPLIPVIRPHLLCPFIILLIRVYILRLFSRRALLDRDLVDRLLQQIFDLDLFLRLLFVLPFQVLKAMDQKTFLALLGLSTGRLQLLV